MGEQEIPGNASRAQTRRIAEEILESARNNQLNAYKDRADLLPWLAQEIVMLQADTHETLRKENTELRAASDDWQEVFVSLPIEVREIIRTWRNQRDGLADLRRFAHEVRHRLEVSVPTPQAFDAIDGLAGRDTDENCAECARDKEQTSAAFRELARQLRRPDGD